MLTGRDIIYISSIEWDFLWQQNQEIAIRLGRAGNRVLYIENTGVRAPGLGDAKRVFSRLKRWSGALSSSGVREVSPNVYVCSPLVLPPFGSGLRRFLNTRVLLPLVRRAARSLNFRDPLIWTYLPTDTARDLIKLFKTPASLVVYYCLADFPQLSPNPQQVEQSEKLLVESSQLVFANCESLAKRLGRWTDAAHVFPPGVNMDAFPLGEVALNQDSKQHLDEVKTFPKPVIGYIGGVHKHVDLALLSEIARLKPEWSFVLVGPFQTAVDALQARPNIHLIGPKPHPVLVRYLRTFDVCIVPYVKSVYTETVVPVKINEYLAAGKPVVSTDLPTVKDFNSRHQILSIANNEPAAFIAAIEQAIELPLDEPAIAKRREVAALLDWEVIVQQMSELIEAKLPPGPRPLGPRASRPH